MTLLRLSLHGQIVTDTAQLRKNLLNSIISSRVGLLTYMLHISENKSAPSLDMHVLP